ncbi:BQ2448_3610 [Microbotryum intermedium]|uniref:BQ2448_3610 protein n=1 Tax=Microbotryum intermedium TaxID=269621 RepID=A0A238FI46_9BASI|nr:BQ2448_3610 [Microbotryum intermedium]
MIIRSARKYLPLQRTFSTPFYPRGGTAHRSTSSIMLLPPPTTLSSALERIRDLEKRLAVAEHAIQHTTGQTLSQLLGEDESASKATAGTPQEAAVRAASTSVTRDQASGTTTERNVTESETTTQSPEPIDISALVLKALGIKKGVHIGSIPDDEAVAQVEKLWDGLELTEEQKDQLRTWAGL